MSNLPNASLVPIFIKGSLKKSVKSMVNLIIEPISLNKLKSYFYQFDEIDFQHLKDKLLAEINQYRQNTSPTLSYNTELFVEFKSLGMLFAMKRYSLSFTEKIKEETYYFELTYIENPSYF